MSNMPKLKKKEAPEMIEMIITSFLTGEKTVVVAPRDKTGVAAAEVIDKQLKLLFNN